MNGEGVEDLDPPRCPHCRNDDAALIESKGNQWLCLVCTRTWYALRGANDRRFLRSLRIAPPKG